MNSHVARAAESARKTADVLLLETRSAADREAFMDNFTPPMVVLVKDKQAIPLVHTPEGLILNAMFNHSKDAYVSMLKLLLEDIEADGVVLMMSAWLAIARPGETERKPSEDPDRESVLILNVDDGQSAQTLVGVMDGAGKLCWDVRGDSFEGRFTHLMPRRFKLDPVAGVKIPESPKIDKPIF